MIEAIYRRCHDVNQTIIAFINKRDRGRRCKHEWYTSCAIPDEMFAGNQGTGSSGTDGGGCIHRREAASVRRNNIREITDKLAEAFRRTMRSGFAVLGEGGLPVIGRRLSAMILRDQKRPDGRAINQIRPR